MSYLSDIMKARDAREQQECVACQGEIFVGDVLEVTDHLCLKHKKEYIDERVEELKQYLDAIKDLYEK